MLAHPILINRPIVVTPKGVARRPSEAVLDILPNPDIGPFVKEDGEVIETWSEGSPHSPAERRGLFGAGLIAAHSRPESGSERKRRLPNFCFRGQIGVPSI